MQQGLIVVADQHPVMLEGVRRLLETEAQSVLMVADEASLLKAVQRTFPDLVIVDLSLPVAGAANVMRLLKNHHPEIRILIMSVHDEGAALAEVMVAGAEGFILKRRIAIDLLPALKAIREGRRYVSPDVDQRERWCAAVEAKIHGAKS